jgi:hypothetical protein
VSGVGANNVAGLTTVVKTVPLKLPPVFAVMPLAPVAPPRPSPVASDEARLHVRPNRLPVTDTAGTRVMPSGEFLKRLTAEF